MSRPGIGPGPPAWEASTLEKSHLDSLFAGYSEPLLGLRQVLHPVLYNFEVTRTFFSLHCKKSRCTFKPFTTYYS
jgi:hypothetical protein